MERQREGEKGKKGEERGAVERGKGRGGEEEQSAKERERHRHRAR